MKIPLAIIKKFAGLAYDYTVIVADYNFVTFSEAYKYYFKTSELTLSEYKRFKRILTIKKRGDK